MFGRIAKANGKVKQHRDKQTERATTSHPGLKGQRRKWYNYSGRWGRGVLHCRGQDLRGTSWQGGPGIVEETQWLLEVPSPQQEERVRNALLASIFILPSSLPVPPIGWTLLETSRWWKSGKWHFQGSASESKQAMSLPIGDGAA